MPCQRRAYPLIRRTRQRFGAAAQKAEKGQLDLVSAADIAARFRKGKSVEKEIALTLRAFVRFGDLATPDGGKTFQLRQVA